MGGALYLEDFRRMMQKIGCNDYRLMTSKIDLIDEEMKLKAGLIEFYSMTVRAFKLELEDRCEDHGQIATYLEQFQKHPTLLCWTIITHSKQASPYLFAETRL